MIRGPVKLKFQLLRGEGAAIGPGKAAVLEAIDETGSISAAGRHLGMSYRRIWLLVSSLNADWIGPVVETKVGGGATGGTRLTALGRTLLLNYRIVENRMLEAASGPELDLPMASVRPASAESALAGQ